MKLLPASILAFVLLASSQHSAMGGALEFSGTAGQYVQVPNFSALGVTGEVTVEFWARPADQAQRQVFVLVPDDAANRFQAHIPWDNGAVFWDFGNINGGGAGRLDVAAPAGTVGTWRHYALVASQSGNFMRIYQNGSLIASKTGMDPLENTGGAPLRIGGPDGLPFKGALDDFRVWNAARTEAQIRAALTLPPAGSEPGLRLLLLFDEPGGTAAVNSATATGAAHNGSLTGSPARVAQPGSIFTVANTTDSGPGSLRQALADAALAAGPDTIAFASALSGQTITLTSEIVIADSGVVMVDATSLAAGITVTGGNARRLLSLSSGAIATLRGLTLTGGNGTGSAGSGNGGAIYNNNATLTLDRCTLHGNTAPAPVGDGGAVFNNFGTLTLTNCTLASNTAAFRGGAIFNKGPLTLIHCTVAGNAATSVSSGKGGGIFNDFVPCTLDNSIVATNSAASGAQILQDGSTLTRRGANLTDVSLSNGAALAGSGTINNAAPTLAALASNGGPAQTMSPNPGSPAIDAAAGSTATTDQRGVPRPQGGAADIGAVEAISTAGLVVQNTADSGPGSLRQAVLNGPFISGVDTITFAAGLSGGTIVLTSGQLTLGSEVTIDATGLANGLTLSGNSDGDIVLEPGESRIFDIPGGVAVTLRGLHFINGIADPANLGINGRGGAIRSSGQLTVEQCFISACRARDGGGIAILGGSATLTQSTLSGNSAQRAGGGIDSFGTVTVTQSTLSDNSAQGDGGGIYNGGTVTVTQSTFSDNSAQGDGGGIYNSGTLTVTQGTLSGNSAQGSGGGIFNVGTVTLNNSIVAGNTALSFQNIDGSFTGPNNLTSGNPLLAALGNYGGPTQTMALLPGSPARDAAGSVTNPGFEANTFGGTSIYTGSITGWTSNDPARTGLSLGGSPFTDNGVIPEGTQVAFLQSLNGQPATLSTTLTGLAPGQNYTVTFRVNARAGYSPTAPMWTVNGGAAVSFDGSPVGGTNPYRTITGSFTATAGTAPLAITNHTGSGTDSTLLLDAVTVALTGGDQRGFPVVGPSDIGAYEAGTITDFDAWIYETLPANANAAQHAPADDYDGDGQSNELEWLTGTDPASHSSVFRPTPGTTAGNLTITFPTAPGRTYRLCRSDNLDAWTECPVPPISGNGSDQTFTVSIIAGRGFFQVVPQLQ